MSTEVPVGAFPPEETRWAVPAQTVCTGLCQTGLGAVHVRPWGCTSPPSRNHSSHGDSYHFLFQEPPPSTELPDHPAYSGQPHVPGIY